MTYRNNFNSKSIGNSRLNTNKITSNINNVNKIITKYVSSNSEELKFKNNVFNMESGKNYKIKTLTHGYADVTVKQNKYARLSMYEAYGPDASEAFSEDEFNDMAQSTKLINIIGSNDPLDEKLNVLRTFFPNSQEVRARLESLGAETGQMIQLDNKSEKVLFEPNGWLYTQEDLKGLRETYLDRDFFQLGCTKDSKFIIDGKEFKLDSTGHLNIPEGTICTPTRVKIIN